MTTCLPKTTVLVTSAGTASAINIIKSLRRADGAVRTVAVDADASAAGLRLADAYRVVPKAASPDYIPALLDIAAAEGVSALYAVYSREIQTISEKQQTFHDRGIVTLLAPPDTIALCNDKSQISAIASRAAVRSPRAYTPEGALALDADAYPLFAKPLVGSSSVGAMRLNDRSELEQYMRSHSETVVQEFVDGPEVTVDVFCNRDSEAMVIAPRLRLSTKAGQSVKGKTIPNERFVQPVRAICKTLRMVGTCNFQFILDAEELVLIEVNPRYAAGGLMLTVEAGANIPLLALKEMLGLPIAREECEVRSGVMMSRYWEEVFWTEKETCVSLSQAAPVSSAHTS